MPAEKLTPNNVKSQLHFLVILKTAIDQNRHVSCEHSYISRGVEDLNFTAVPDHIVLVNMTSDLCNFNI